MSRDSVWIPKSFRLNYLLRKKRYVRDVFSLDVMIDSFRFGELFFLTNFDPLRSVIATFDKSSNDIKELVQLGMGIEGAIDLDDKVFFWGTKREPDVSYWAGFFDGSTIQEIDIPPSQAILDAKLTDDHVFISSMKDISMYSRKFRLSDITSPIKTYSIGEVYSFVVANGRIFAVPFPSSLGQSIYSSNLIEINLSSGKISEHDVSNGYIERLLEVNGVLYWISEQNNCIIAASCCQPRMERAVICEKGEIQNLRVSQGYVYWAFRTTSSIRRVNISCLQKNFQ